MPTSLSPPPLEVVLQALYDSEIRCGIQNEPPAGGITAWIDFGSQTEKATFYGTIVVTGPSLAIGRSGLRPTLPPGCTRLHCASSQIAPMLKKPRARPSVADRFREAIKELIAERQTRTYAVQWIMVHSVARHLGISDEEAQEAIKAAGHRFKRAGDPPHSVSLIYGWGEE